jgi:glutamate racemase
VVGMSLSSASGPADLQRLAQRLRVSTVGNDAPIGVFDSGVGGLTVARALLDQLPGEPLLYVGDTAHGPYGPLPIADVRRHALAAMDALVGQGVKLLVIACNSASSACLRDARERYDVTVASGAYDDAFAAAPQVTLTSAACPRFVDFVERGVTTGRQLLQLATHYLEPVVGADVDTLVLGCTHYPLLTGMISLVVGEDVTLVSSAEETAKDVYRVLTQQGLGRDEDAPPPVHRFLSTGDAEPFARLGRRFLGPEVGTVGRLEERLCS